MAARSAVRGSVVNPQFIYGSANITSGIEFRDITVGYNGYSCLVGYDLVTGLGSWVADCTYDWLLLLLLLLLLVLVFYYMLIILLPHSMCTKHNM